MEFRFSCEQLLNCNKDGISILNSEDVPKSSNQKQNLSQILDLMGVASSKVLKNITTTYSCIFFPNNLSLSLLILDKVKIIYPIIFYY